MKSREKLKLFHRKTQVISEMRAKNHLTQVPHAGSLGGRAGGEGGECQGGEVGDGNLRFFP